ncbi:MAG TPA: hypothetical protein VFJ06_02715 [Halococcus sp.]|nr:hypothetical protein [Halococcus sp.]
MVSDDAASSSWRGVPGRLLSGLNSAERTDRPAGSIPLSTETVCELLSNARRRAVIVHIAALDAEETVQMGDLARTIAGEEHDIPPETVSAEQRKTVYVSLLQNHLPKLDAAGVVEWNDRSGDIARGECVEELAALVESIVRACEPEREHAA